LLEGFLTSFFLIFVAAVKHQLCNTLYLNFLLHFKETFKKKKVL